MCPRLWPIEDICIGLYVLSRRLYVRHILEKVMSMQHSFEEFSEKQRRVELKSVGNFVAKAVLVESTNLFSLEKLCRTQLIQLEIFFETISTIRPSGKTLIRWKMFCVRSWNTFQLWQTDFSNRPFLYKALHLFSLCHRWLIYDLITMLTSMFNINDLCKRDGTHKKKDQM